MASEFACRQIVCNLHIYNSYVGILVCVGTCICWYIVYIYSNWIIVTVSWLTVRAAPCDTTMNVKRRPQWAQTIFNTILVVVAVAGCAVAICKPICTQNVYELFELTDRWSQSFNRWRWASGACVCIIYTETFASRYLHYIHYTYRFTVVRCVQCAPGISNRLSLFPSVLCLFCENFAQQREWVADAWCSNLQQLNAM